MNTPGDMLTCREVIELVTDYLDGALPPDDLARFQHHINDCDGCDGFVDQIRTTIRVTGQSTPEMLTADERDRLVAAFRTWNTAPAKGRERESLLERLRRVFTPRR